MPGRPVAGPASGTASGTASGPPPDRPPDPPPRQLRRSSGRPSGPAFRPVSEGSRAASQAPEHPVQRAPRERSGGALPQPRAPDLFEYALSGATHPQIRGLSSVHTLGTATVTHNLSTGLPGEGSSDQVNTLWNCAQPLSTGCGQNLCPQHLPPLCPTVHPQVAASCAQGAGTSPHRCPLFGNPGGPLTVRSESGHTDVDVWPVEYRGKAGDAPVEYRGSPGDGLCRTFCSPQGHGVVHRCRPQGRWIKNWG